MKLIKSFGWAMSGLVAVWREERNFRIEICAALAAIGLGIFFGITAEEWLFLVLAIVLVLSGEIVNTAVEDLCDKIEPDQDPVIGRVKNIMAGYVFLTSLGGLALGILVFGRYLV